MKHLIASIVCFTIAALAFLHMGCREYQPFPQGKEITAPPPGYTIHCREFPDSIFCEDE